MNTANYCLEIFKILRLTIYLCIILSCARRY